MVWRYSTQTGFDGDLSSWWGHTVLNWCMGDSCTMYIIVMTTAIVCLSYVLCVYNPEVANAPLVLRFELLPQSSVARDQPR